jgi:hypothetical protein
VLALKKGVFANVEKCEKDGENWHKYPLEGATGPWRVTVGVDSEEEGAERRKQLWKEMQGIFSLTMEAVCSSEAAEKSYHTT